MQIHACPSPGLLQEQSPEFCLTWMSSGTTSLPALRRCLPSSEYVPQLSREVLGGGGGLSACVNSTFSVGSANEEDEEG